MKKFMTMAALTLFLVDGTSQIVGGIGNILTGTLKAATFQSDAKAVTEKADRWADHEAFMAEGTDPSGMSVTG